MLYTVQFTRFFAEFGWEDVDTMEFDNLKDANDFYEIHKNDENVKLFVGKDRIR